MNFRALDITVKLRRKCENKWSLNEDRMTLGNHLTHIQHTKSMENLFNNYTLLLCFQTESLWINHGKWTSQGNIGNDDNSCWQLHKQIDRKKKFQHCLGKKRTKFVKLQLKKSVNEIKIKMNAINKTNKYSSFSQRTVSN